MIEDYYMYLFFGITIVCWFIGSMWYAIKEKINNPIVDITTPILSALTAPLLGPLVAGFVAMVMPIILVVITFDELICMIANRFRKNYNGAE